MLLTAMAAGFPTTHQKDSDSESSRTDVLSEGNAQDEIVSVENEDEIAVKVKCEDGSGSGDEDNRLCEEESDVTDSAAGDDITDSNTESDDVSSEKNGADEVVSEKSNKESLQTSSAELPSTTTQTRIKPLPSICNETKTYTILYTK